MSFEHDDEVDFFLRLANQRGVTSEQSISFSLYAIAMILRDRMR